MMNYRLLSQSVTEFEAVIYEHACDPRGIVRMFISREGLRPLSECDFSPGLDFCAAGVSAPDFISYEDAGMATGAMLAAASLRARLTGEAAAGQRAVQMFKAVRAIYQLGESHEEGHFPKPYGGRCSGHVSRDQYLFALLGLREYAAIATAAERQTIAQMASAMVRYWMRRDYRIGYFNLPSASQLDDHMGPLFLGLLAVACELCDEEGFFREYLELAVKRGLAGRSAETLFTLYRQGQRYDGGTYLRQNEHSTMMKAVTLDCLWEFDGPRKPQWREALARFWQDDIRAGVDLRDGLQYHFLRYDSVTDTTHLTGPGHVPDLECKLNFAEMTWGGHRKRAGSVQSAHSAFIVADRLANREAARFGSTILSRLRLDSFAGIHVPAAEHVPPGKEWEAGLIRTGYVAMWLWAYWMAQYRGVLLPVQESTGGGAKVSPSNGCGTAE